MTDNKVISEFARKVLGCNCPEDVFKYIDCRTDVNIHNDLLLDYEINIGNRLLIFAAEIHKADSLKYILTKLVKAGINKRDKMKFNRFRLVLLTDTTNDIAGQASGIFDSLGTDDKVHLHVINKDDFPIIHNHNI
jgi:hypothetical protein